MRCLSGRYELAESLGSGGMAQVFAAHDRMLDRRVAVKLVHDGRTSARVDHQRLLREARGAAGLHHPNTVAVFDAGEDDGQAFIVMELVRGASLSERLRQGPLGIDETVALLDGVLAGLTAAHRCGLVHRDVKPSNILLPDEGGVKLADFGIAKAVAGVAGDDLTATGEVLGTPRYLAPEQAAGASASPAADLYSVGVVAYECLAGRAPFEGDTPMAIALAHQRDPVPSLAALAPHVPPGLVAAVERALAKAPADRYADAEEMRTALRKGARGGNIPRAPTRPMAPVDAAGTTRRLAPTPTDRRVGPAVAAAPRGAVSRIGPAVLVVLVLVAVAAGALLLRGGGVGEVPPADEPPADTPADTSDADASDDEAPDDADGPEADEDADVPADPDEEESGDLLDELIEQLEDDPEAGGEKGGDLLDDLREVRERRGDDQRHKARETIEEIADWLDGDELDPTVGQRAVLALEPIGRPSAPALAEVSGLFAEVAMDPAVWGENADSLVSELRALLDADGRSEQTDVARDLLEDVDGWADDGEIAAERAERIRVALGAPPSGR